MGGVWWECLEVFAEEGGVEGAGFEFGEVVPFEDEGVSVFVAEEGVLVVEG